MYDTWIVQPWPWWTGGLALGLFIVFYTWVFNRSFGISRTFESAMREPFGARSSSGGVSMQEALARMGAGDDTVDATLPQASSSFRNVDMDPLSLILGVLLGAVVMGQLEGKDFSFALSPAHEAVLALGTMGQTSLLLAGGLLVGFGARMAGGCPSGHALGGLSSLSLASLIAVMGYFLGGIPVTFILQRLAQ